MKTFKITFSNGDTIITGFNGSELDANNYFVGKVFNLGCEGDLMVKGILVEEL